MGIPRVRTSVICVHQGKLLAFRAQDPHSKQEFVFLPGGQVESDETAPEAGARETLEETGFLVNVHPLSSTDREYVFHWNNQDYDCLTLFYLATLASPMQRPVNDASYNLGVVWVLLNEVESTFSYSKDILEAILELLATERDQT